MLLNIYFVILLVSLILRALVGGGGKMTVRQCYFIAKSIRKVNINDTAAKINHATKTPGIIKLLRVFFFSLLVFCIDTITVRQTFDFARFFFFFFGNLLFDNAVSINLDVSPERASINLPRLKTSNE